MLRSEESLRVEVKTQMMTLPNKKRIYAELFIDRRAVQSILNGERRNKD